MTDLRSGAAKALGAAGLAVASLGLTWALLGAPAAHADYGPAGGAEYGPMPGSSASSATTTPGSPTTTPGSSSTTDSPSKTSSELAYTGADIGIMVAAGAAAIGAGGVFVLAVRRRRPGSGPHSTLDGKASCGADAP